MLWTWEGWAGDGRRAERKEKKLKWRGGLRGRLAWVLIGVE